MSDNLISNMASATSNPTSAALILYTPATIPYAPQPTSNSPTAAPSVFDNFPLDLLVSILEAVLIYSWMQRNLNEDDHEYFQYPWAGDLNLAVLRVSKLWYKEGLKVLYTKNTLIITRTVSGLGVNYENLPLRIRNFFAHTHSLEPGYINQHQVTRAELVKRIAFTDSDQDDLSHAIKGFAKNLLFVNGPASCEFMLKVFRRLETFPFDLVQLSVIIDEADYRLLAFMQREAAHRQFKMRAAISGQVSWYKPQGLRDVRVGAKDALKVGLLKVHGLTTPEEDSRTMVPTGAPLLVAFSSWIGTTGIAIVHVRHSGGFLARRVREDGSLISDQEWYDMKNPKQEASTVEEITEDGEGGEESEESNDSYSGNNNDGEGVRSGEEDFDDFEHGEDQSSEST